MTKQADSDRIKTWLEGINQFNATAGEGTTRILFTREELAAREYIKDEMAGLGLLVTEDAIGNIFGLLKGTEPELAPVWTGSHIDTVPNAGMFDGMAGIVSGLEAVRLIKEEQAIHKRSIAVVVYTSEEPTRFGLSCLGSRALAGELSLADTKTLLDNSGRSLYEVLADTGHQLAEFDKIEKSSGDVYAAVELHIEQNRQLDENNVPVGIVKSICAPTNYMVRVKGCQSHAGGTSMSDRQDAFTAACELALVTEQLARDSQGEYVTGTVGWVEIFPNAVNVIPGEVCFSIDIRSVDMAAKNEIKAELLKAKARIEQERKVIIEMEMENDDLPLACDKRIAGMLKDECKARKLPYLELISGPYHDSLFIGRIAPTAMIFVPSKDGISHSKEEWTSFTDIAAGTDLLTQVLLDLANEV